MEWGNLSDDQKQAIEERKRQLKSDRDSLTRDFAVASIAAQNGDTEAMAETERQSFNTPMGFSIPNIGVPAGGMAY